MPEDAFFLIPAVLPYPPGWSVSGGAEPCPFPLPYPNLAVAYRWGGILTPFVSHTPGPLQENPGRREGRRAGRKGRRRDGGDTGRAGGLGENVWGEK